VLRAVAVEGLPEIHPGDDLAELIAGALQRQQEAVEPGDVLVMAHKIVSKAEGRIRHLADVQPGPKATELGQALGKDPRHVQVVLDESKAVRRASHGVLICVTHHGYVCANAGVDASNVPGEGTVVLLPKDPDASARKLRSDLTQRLGAKPAVLITDSFGRAWRHGQVDVAIGCAGLDPLEDWRGRPDATGRELTSTRIAVADELAAAADLARTKDGALPLVLVRGAGRHVGAGDGPGAAAMIRPEAEDLFR
jgi:coenzyme F420-0:L-glutamate ligase/coenzyme F420-1:gamma-L-glutamate ligase